MKAPVPQQLMTLIALHQNWQMNLLLSIDPSHPRYQSRDDLHTTTKTWMMNILWPIDHLVPEQRCLAYHYTKLGRWIYFGWWIPLVPSRDDLHTTTQNLVDESTLGDGSPWYHPEMTCIPLLKTWQMNLLWPLDPPKYKSRDPLACTLHKTWQMSLLWLKDPLTLHNRVDMPCIPLHKTWQMILCWLIDTPLNWE